MLTSSNGTTYTPGQKQTLTIKITDPVARVYGFQISARLGSDHTKQAGTFTPGTRQFVLCAATSLNDFGTNRPSSGACPATKPLEFAEHTAPFTTGTITVDWTPPATASGNIDIYVAANAANGNTTELGDHIYTSSLTVTPAVRHRPAMVQLCVSTVSLASRVSADRLRSHLEVGLNLRRQLRDFFAAVGWLGFHGTQRSHFA